MIALIFLTAFDFTIQDISAPRATITMPEVQILPIVILPENPPADAYEKVKGLYIGRFEGEEACILEFQSMEIPENHPVDHDGFPLMLDSDGLTLLPQQDIVDGIDQRTCTWK